MLTDMIFQAARLQGYYIGAHFIYYLGTYTKKIIPDSIGTKQK